jgi:hypothetical protein
MANNIFQVKRTSTSGRTPNTTNSANTQYINAGELALNMTDKILYTSDGTNLITVGANSPSYSTGSGYGTATGGAVVNATTVAIGNSSVNVSINSTAFSGTANNATNLGGVAAASYVQNTDSRILSGNLNFTGTNTYFSGKVTHAANVIINSGISIIDSTGSQGTVGQVLTSNGAGNVYWTGSSGGWTGGTMANTVTFSNVVTFTANVITSANLYVNSAIFLNGSNGQAGQVLTSNGTGNAYWSTVTSGGGSTPVRQQYTGDGTTTIFTVTGGYASGSISVFINGVMLRNGTDVTVTNGSTFTLASAAPNGSLIDVIGTATYTSSGVPTQTNTNLIWVGSNTTTYVSPNALANALAITTAPYSTGIVSIDMSTGRNFVVTLTAASTLANATNIVVGQSGIIKTIQDGAGSRTLAFQSMYKFDGDTSFTIGTTASKSSIISYYVTSSTSILLNLVAVNTSA